jgi:PadR family transcriptional regulator PadR
MMAGADLNLLRETLELLILKALAWGPRHGYAVAEWIEQATQATLLIDEGTLYPALHRLAARSLVKAEWGLSENSRRAKYYSLTPAGRARLRSQGAAWHLYVYAIGAALRSTTPEPEIET